MPDHLSDYADKVSIRSGRPSGILPKVDVNVLVGGIVMGQAGDANRGQTSDIPSRAIFEVVVSTIQGSITHAELLLHV